MSHFYQAYLVLKLLLLFYLDKLEGHQTKVRTDKQGMDPKSDILKVYNASIKQYEIQKSLPPTNKLNVV